MLDEDTLDTVRACSKQPHIRVPEPSDKVYKEECAFSFETALSPGGLFLNLSTWYSYGERFVQVDQEKTGNKLYLHEKARKVPNTIGENGKAELRPEKLAIGGEGGFQVSRTFDIEKQQWLVILPEDIRIPLPAPELPDMILNALAAIAAHESASNEETTSAWEEERKVSQYASSLPQLEHGMGKFGRSIPSNPDLWKCDETGVKENLWLNLSTGFFGSGRKNFDGSGGNGAAERHYEATGKQFPLAVKLGTITPNGADVFSYAEDDMVIDPKLAQHLAHWGINMMSMQKTEKTMTELQIDLNMAFEADRITEAGSMLQPLSGPGYVGLENLGNSCYMNSVLQLLWTIPAVRQRYAAAAVQIFKSAPADPVADFPTQMAKVGRAMCEGETGQAEEEDPIDEGVEPMAVDGEQPKMFVKPQALKHLVGKGHPEFSTMRQQDASEYFQHLIAIMTRAERVSTARLGPAGEGSTASAFEFSIEARKQCSESGRVSYKRDAPTNILSLNIPMDAAANKEEVQEYQEREAKRAKLKESNADAYIQQDSGGEGQKVISSTSQESVVLPRVPLSACLQLWAADDEMGDYYSEALGRKTKATAHQRLANFPPFLVVQLNRFYLASDWTSKKLEVLVDVPEKLDLEFLRGRGLQPGEEAQPDIPEPAVAPSQPAAIQADPQIVAALTAMGFSENGSRRAAVATQNVGTEASMDWVLAHMGDPDFDDPLPAPAPAVTGDFKAHPESVAMLSSMGFTERQATAALKACQGSLERAGDWLFSHAADLEAAVNDVLQTATTQDRGASAACRSPLSPLEALVRPCIAYNYASSAELEDGTGRYRLVGFVSHMGANTACGHYVCHLFKEGRWIIFNDEKVAVSENPPKELGYLYLFRREDVATV